MSAAIMFIIAALLGAMAGSVHLLLLSRSVSRLIRDRSAGHLLLGAPVRVALPALALLSCALWSPYALAGAATGLVLMQVVALSRVSSEGRV